MGSISLVDALGRTSDERQALKEKAAAINAEAAANWHSPEWRQLMAAEITEQIMEGFEHEALVSLLADTDSVGWDDDVTVSEVKGMKATWVGRGGYIETSNVQSEKFRLTRDVVGFHVFENEDKLRSNFAETQANLINMGVMRLDAEINLFVLRTMQAAIDTSHDSYVSGAGLSLAALNTAIREVADETHSLEGITLVGRSTMTQQILDALADIGATNSYGGFIPESNESIARLGVLGTYRGARIVTLRNYKDDEDVSYFPANELYVVSRDASKFAFFGGLEGREWTEDENDYWHYKAKREFGGTVHRPERLRRIVDTNLSA